MCGHCSLNVWSLKLTPVHNRLFSAVFTEIALNVFCPPKELEEDDAEQYGDFKSFEQEDNIEDDGDRVKRSC